MNVRQLSPSFSGSPQVKPEEVPELARAAHHGVVNRRPAQEEPGRLWFDKVGTRVGELRKLLQEREADGR